GNDRVDGIVDASGGSAADVLIGDGHANTLSGNGGADYIEGGSGNDIISGGAGDDRIVYRLGDGFDTADGGADTDTLVLIETTGGAQIELQGSAATLQVRQYPHNSGDTPLVAGTSIEKIEVSFQGGNSEIGRASCRERVG